VKDLLHLILKKLTMSQETLDELKALATSASASLDKIKEDITRIISTLPAEGGLTAAEVAELRTSLSDLAKKADDLDKENEPA
jgi:uncharacterized protein involved in exopolysaccharide biosynthesis